MNYGAQLRFVVYPPTATLRAGETRVCQGEKIRNRGHRPRLQNTDTQLESLRLFLPRIGGRWPRTVPAGAGCRKKHLHLSPVVL
jgi:hypothetical protein